MARRLPRSTLFPYTTLFRSARTALPCAGSRTSAAVLPRAPRNGSRAELVPARRRRSSCARHRRAESEEHTSELQSLAYLVCRLLLEKKKNTNRYEIMLQLIE